MDNYQIIDKWVTALETKGEGGYFNRKDKNINFSDDTIYSYGNHFKMAQVIGGIVFFNTGKYSRTTTQHQSMLNGRLHASSLQVVYLPFERNITVPIGLEQKVAVG